MEAKVAEPLDYAAELIDLMAWIISDNVQMAQIHSTIESCKYSEANTIIRDEPLAEPLTYLLEFYDGIQSKGDLVETVKDLIETKCEEWEGVRMIKDYSGVSLPRYQVECLALRHVLMRRQERPNDPDLPTPGTELAFVQALDDKWLYEWATEGPGYFPRKAK